MTSANRLRAIPRLTEAGLGTLDALAAKDREGVRVSGGREEGIRRCRGTGGGRGHRFEKRQRARYCSRGAARPRNRLRQAFGWPASEIPKTAAWSRTGLCG